MSDKGEVCLQSIRCVSASFFLSFRCMIIGGAALMMPIEPLFRTIRNRGNEHRERGEGRACIYRHACDLECSCLHRVKNVRPPSPQHSLGPAASRLMDFGALAHALRLSHTHNNNVAGLGCRLQRSKSCVPTKCSN